MATLPAKAIVQASARWLHLLQKSTVSQAAVILKADAAYVDLTMTQYGLGLDLLKQLGALRKHVDGSWVLSPDVANLPVGERQQLVFERLLEYSAPAWLRDADVLVPDQSEVPLDAVLTAEALELSEHTAFSVIQNVHGHIDLEQRRLTGLAGEQALLRLLEQRWPGSTTHVAAVSDSFGYDILFRHEGREWHLEVKTTGRRGRLLMYLSRHEYEVSLRDPLWRLVVAGVDSALDLRAVATVKHSVFAARGPVDSCTESRWQSASHELTAPDLQRGFAFIAEADFWESGNDPAGPETPEPAASRFLWLPG